MPITPSIASLPTCPWHPLVPRGPPASGAGTILARQLSHTITGKKKKKKSNNLEALQIFRSLIIDFTSEVLRSPLLFPALSAALQGSDKCGLDLQLPKLVRESEPEE